MAVPSRPGYLGLRRRRGPWATQRGSLHPDIPGVDTEPRAKERSWHRQVPEIKEKTASGEGKSSQREADWTPGAGGWSVGDSGRAGAPHTCYSHLEASTPRSLGLALTTSPDGQTLCNACSHATFSAFSAFLPLKMPPPQTSTHYPHLPPNHGFLSCSLHRPSSLGFVRSLLSLQIPFPARAPATISVQSPAPREPTPASATRECLGISFLLGAALTSE